MSGWVSSILRRLRPAGHTRKLARLRNANAADLGEQGGLTADFRVLDEGEAELLRQRVLPRVLESFYTSMTPGQTQLADCFGFGRDDRGLEDLVLELHSKVQSHAYPHRWLEEQRQSWASLPEDGGETEFGRALLTRLARKARHWADLLARALEEMSSDGALAKAYGPAFSSVSGQMEALAEAGADLLAVETLMGTDEALAALDAAAGLDLPVLVSFSVEADGGVMFGGTAWEAAVMAQEIKISVTVPMSRMDGR